MSIRELEEEFGVLLMQRNNRGFTLTQEGKYFYDRATSLLHQAGDLEQMMRDWGNRRKRVNVGVPPMIGTILFPKLYKGFRQQYPDIALYSREGSSADLLELVDSRALDFAIVTTNQLTQTRYHIAPICETETLFCVAKKHRLARKKKVSLEEIKDEPLIMFTEGFIQNKLVTDKFSQHGLTPNIIHYSSQFFTIKEFIAEGIAAGFMFKDIARTIPDIVGISLEEPLRIEIGIIWKLNQHMFSDAMRFLKYVRDYAASLQG